ncbi:MAG: glycosyltransferase family 39 protein [Syntrophaceae bacterium]|nr:glycosyltransferase family 39 protein [Syntrophaceae bacterium]
MDKRFFKRSPQPLAQFILLLGFCLVIYFINLGQWDLWNPDEPRYAEVSREMVQGGDWILMHYNGNVYSDKPPLFFWLIAFSSFLWQGFTSFSIRFPSAFFGTLTVLLTFLIGKNLDGHRTGFLGGLILTTGVEFTYLSTRANIDTTLTFFTTASLFCFFQWHRNRSSYSASLAPGKMSFTPQRLSDGIKAVMGSSTGHGNSKNLLIYGFYVAMGFATLTKGPVGFILPLLISIVYLMFQKDWKGIKEMRLLTGMFLFSGIVLCWYLPAIWKGGRTYLDQTLFLHSLNRFSNGWAKGQPIYYYLYDFPTGFFPWIVFLPSAFVYAYSIKPIEKRRSFFFLTIWFVVIFVFFSLSKGKRGIYLLPLFPAASLLVGKLLQDFISSQMDHFRQGWIIFPIYLLLGVMLVAGGVLPWLVSLKFPSFMFYSFPLAFLLVGGSLVMFLSYRFKKVGVMFLLLFGILAAMYFYTGRAIFPLINEHKSARFISKEVSSRIQPGEKLAVYGRLSPAPYNFYTGVVPISNLISPKSFFHFLNYSERVFCLITFDELKQIQALGEAREIHMIARHSVGENDVVLVSNRLE